METRRKGSLRLVAQRVEGWGSPGSRVGRSRVRGSRVQRSSVVGGPIGWLGGPGDVDAGGVEGVGGPVDGPYGERFDDGADECPPPVDGRGVPSLA